ncbi:MAG: hypothetical protein WKF75_20705 [Singulisphaera sp.]
MTPSGFQDLQLIDVLQDDRPARCVVHDEVDGRYEPEFLEDDIRHPDALRRFDRLLDVAHAPSRNPDNSCGASTRSRSLVVARYLAYPGK